MVVPIAGGAYPAMAYAKVFAYALLSIAFRKLDLFKLILTACKPILDDFFVICANNEHYQVIARLGGGAIAL